MSYYLIEHRNPHGKHYYDSRRQGVRGIVVHTAENLPDYDGPDAGAESVARYFASTSRSVSAHVVSDSDSTVPLLPDSYTAFHVRGYNSSTLGLEIATRAHSWGSGPPEWERKVLERAAAVVRVWCVTHGIPRVRRSKGDYAAGLKGILAHADLDPERRTDPGVGFPWDRFMQMVASGPEENVDVRELKQWIDQRIAHHLEARDAEQKEQTRLLREVHRKVVN